MGEIKKITNVTDVTEEMEKNVGTLSEKVYKVELTYDYFGKVHTVSRVLFQTTLEKMKKTGIYVD